MKIRYLVGIVICMVAAAGLYSFSFDNPFVGIDRRVVFENDAFQGSSRDVFSRLSTTTDHDGSSAFYPLSAASLYGTLLLQGSAMTYRLPIVLLHALNAFLLWWVLRAVLKKASPHSTWIALLAAALWLAHPLNVEAVAVIAQRSIVLATFFGLLACVVRLRWSSMVSRVVASLLLLASVTSDPFGLIFVLVTTGACAISQGWTFVRAFRQTSELWAFAVLYILVRAIAGISLPLEFSWSDGAAFMRYLGLAIAPIGLHAERTLRDPSLLMSVAGWLSIGGLIVGSGMVWRKGKKHAAYAFSIVAVYFVLLSASRGTSEMGERWMYVPLMVLCAAASAFIVSMASRSTTMSPRNVRIMILGIGCALIAALSWQTVTYQRSWATVEGYYNQMLVYEPDSAQIRMDLAYAAASEQRIDEAQRQLELAARVEPQNSQIYLLLGNLKRNVGALEGAIEMYEKSIALDDTQVFAFRNLAGIYLQRSEHAKALRLLLRLEELKPDDVAAHYAVAQLYAAAGKKKEALAALERGIPYLQSPDAAAAYEQLLRKLQ